MTLSIEYDFGTDTLGNVASGIGVDNLILPVSAAIPSNWAMSIVFTESGSDTVVYSGGITNQFQSTTNLASNANQIEFRFRHLNPGSPIDSVVWGGPGAQLIANPEPGSFLMLSSILGIGLLRRRR